MSLEVKTFGTLQDGSEVKLYTLQNEKGMSMEVIPYGCRIVKLWVPDREGNMGDVVLGHDDLKQYTNEKDFLGAAIGRFANRIGNSSFVLDGKTLCMAVPPASMPGCGTLRKQTAPMPLPPLPLHILVPMARRAIPEL